MKNQCSVCFRHCSPVEGETGFCRARTMKDGKMICTNYGKLTAVALDPIEKKPLRRFYPGSMILSVGSYGCNLHCPFCQNNEISMITPQEAKTRFVILPSTVTLSAIRITGASIAFVFPSVLSIRTFFH